jgi:hypothetical protein
VPAAFLKGTVADLAGSLNDLSERHTGFDSDRDGLGERRSCDYGGGDGQR